MPFVREGTKKKKRECAYWYAHLCPPLTLFASFVATVDHGEAAQLGPGPGGSGQGQP